MSVRSIELNKALADHLVSLRNSTRCFLFELAELAADIRDDYLHISQKKYVASFRAFWTTYEMDRKFGSLSNFTKYAEAGKAILLVRKAYPDYEERLPTSLRALYEISHLTDAELAICFEDTFYRNEVTSDRSKWQRKGSEPRPLITPEVTEPEIRAWRNQWRTPLPARKNGRPMTFAKIQIHVAESKDDETPISAELHNRLQSLSNILRQAVGNDPTFTLELNADKIIKPKPRCNRKLSDDELQARKKANADRQLEDFLLWLMRQEKNYLDLGSGQKYKSGCYQIFDHFTSISHQDRQVRKKTEKSDGIRTIIVSPTKEEVQLALTKEYFLRFGPRRLLALIYRASRRGAWAEKMQVYDQRFSRRKDVPKLEHDLAAHRKMMFEPSYPLEKRAESKAFVEQVLQLLPESLQELGEAELMERVQRAFPGLSSDNNSEGELLPESMKLNGYAGKAA